MFRVKECTIVYFRLAEGYVCREGPVFSSEELLALPVETRYKRAGG